MVQNAIPHHSIGYCALICNTPAQQRLLLYLYVIRQHMSGYCCCCCTYYPRTVAATAALIHHTPAQKWRSGYYSAGTQYPSAERLQLLLHATPQHSSGYCWTGTQYLRTEGLLLLRLHTMPQPSSGYCRTDVHYSSAALAETTVLVRNALAQ